MMTWYSPCGYSRTDLFSGAGTGIAECPQCHSFQWSSIPPQDVVNAGATATVPDGAVPGLPVNWPSPSTNTPNVDEHPLEHYWSDRMTEPRPADVERLARWLEEAIEKSGAAGTVFAYRAWARELLLRLSLDPAEGLDEAWAAVEAVLPEGWSILVGDSRRAGKPGYWATASQPFQEDIRGYTIVSTTDHHRSPDDNPAAALRFLAAELAARHPAAEETP